MTEVLLADDDQAITAELVPFLRRSGFDVHVAHDGEETLRKAQSLHPDLLVLDIVMPLLDGREVCRQLRAMGNWTPVIMLTRIGNAGERAMTLEEGADDYLNKPFDPVELVARIKSVLRRGAGRAPSLATARRVASGDLMLDRPSRRAFHVGREIPVTGKAFAILEYLMLHQGEVVARERLLDTIWGWDYPAATRAVDVRIAELRRALGDDVEHPRYLETVIGEGYRFAGPVDIVG